MNFRGVPWRSLGRICDLKIGHATSLFGMVASRATNFSSRDHIHLYNGRVIKLMAVKTICPLIFKFVSPLFTRMLKYTLLT